MAKVGKRYFTDEFKREAVTLWETSGRMQTDVARELGIMPTIKALAACTGGQGHSACGEAAVIADGVAGGSGVGDCQAAPRARSHAHGARHSKKAVGICAEMPR